MTHFTLFLIIASNSDNSSDLNKKATSIYTTAPIVTGTKPVMIFEILPELNMLFKYIYDKYAITDIAKVAIDDIFSDR